MTKKRSLQFESLEDRRLLAVWSGAEPACSAAAGGTAEPLPLSHLVNVWVVNTVDDPAVWDETDAILSLREALGGAAEGDVITFDSGLAGQTIALGGTELAITRGVTVSASGIGGIVIDAGGQSRVFSVTGSGTPVLLSGLTLTGGNNFSGGAVYNDGVLTLTGCTVTSNRSDYLCGGVYNYGGTLTMTGCIVSENSAGYGGGGVYNNAGHLEMTDCQIRNNTGGGIFGFAGSTALSGCTVTGNSASSGAGISASSGSVSLTACVVSDNRAEGDGAGISIYNGTLTLSNCALFGNRAGTQGGGIYAGASEITIEYTTIAGNRAADGGGAAAGTGSLRLAGSIVALNSAETQPDISLGVCAYSGQNNLVGFDPGFAVAPLFDSSGNLLNLAETDLSLRETSIAIDRGERDSGEGGTDLSGRSRFYPAKGEVPLSDLGAYEFQQRAGQTEEPSCTVTTLSDVADPADGLISLREALFYAGAGETVTFAPALAEGRILLGGTELWCEKSVTIDARSSSGITIDAGGKSRVISALAPEDAFLSMSGITVTGGSAKLGGGIYQSGALRLEACSVLDNEGEEGGGIWSSGSLTLAGCAVYGNRAVLGGGIRNESGSLSVSGCTVAANRAVGSHSGGGISNFGDLFLVNSIVALNSGGDLDHEITPQKQGRLWGNNNIVARDPGLEVSPVFDSAGNLTNLAALDLSLSETSWGIDRGDSSAALSGTDLAGNPRVRASWQADAIVDIGAYEYQGRFAKQPETPSTQVTTLLDLVDETDGLISLREAVLYAPPGGCVTFAPSLAGKSLTLTEGELWIDRNISIDAGGIGGVTIGTGWTGRVFYVSGGSQDAPVTLTGLAVTEALSAGGSAVCNTGVLVLTECVFSDNIAEGIYPCGGAVNNSGTLTLAGCTLSMNSAVSEKGYSSYGGAIANSGSLTVRDSLLADNDASYGGAVSNTAGRAAFENSTLSGNIAEIAGGAVSNLDGVLTAERCLVTGNRSESAGGGLDNAGTAVLVNCGIFGNTAYNGGGLCNESLSDLSLSGCTVAGNRAEYAGGGIYSYYLYDPGSVTVENSIAVLNKAGLYGADIYNTVCMKGTASLSTFTGWNESEENLLYDPAKPLFADASKGDYTLAENSQAIGRGRNSCAAGRTDLAGNPRISGKSVDIGAYEFPQTALAAPAILTGTAGFYVSAGANRHRIVWTGIDNAAGYQLAYSADGTAWLYLETAETSAVIPGLEYGSLVVYRVRALAGTNRADSPWSDSKQFRVCPADINNDGDISGADRAYLIKGWLSERGDEEYLEFADIDGDGDISSADRAFLAANWLADPAEDAMVYPPAACADRFFAEYASLVEADPLPSDTVFPPKVFP